MASTPDSVLIGVRLQGLGDNTNTWGDDKLNNVLSVLAHSTHGVYSQAMTGDTTISETNYATDNETETSVLLLTGSLSSAANLTIPSRERNLDIYNTTGQTVTVKTSGGTGVSIPNGYMAAVYCDGSEVYGRKTFFNGTVRGSQAAENGEFTTLLQVSDLIAAQLTSGDGSLLVSADDTTRKFLESAVTSAKTNAAFATINGGGNEQSQLTVEDLALVDGGVQTGNFTAVAGRIYWITANATVTLPASISVKDRICLVIGNGVTATLDPNGNNINGSSSNLAVSDPQTLFISVPDTSSGWV